MTLSRVFLGLCHLSPSSTNLLLKHVLSYHLHAQSLACTSRSLTVVDQCRNVEELKQIHAQIVLTGFIHDTLYARKVMNMYTALGNIHYCLLIFDDIRNPDVLMCNTLLRGCISSNSPSLAICFYKELMRRGLIPDCYTLPLVIKVCTQHFLHQEGREFHTHVVKLGLEGNMYVQNRLIHMYAEFGNMRASKQVFDSTIIKDVASWTSLVQGYVGCGEFSAARQLFDKMPDKNVVVWTSMMNCFSQDNEPGVAVSAFFEMKSANLEVDEITMVALAGACAQLVDVRVADWVHGISKKLGLESDLYMSTALVDMFGKCHCIDVARTLFDGMINKNVVSWNAMIGVYARCGQIDLSYHIFNQMPFKNLSSWNALIAGCMRCGRYHEALKLFANMICCNNKPDQFTLLTLIPGISRSRDLISGKQVHSFVYKSRIQYTTNLGNSLVDMYAKCGCMDMARRLFDSMHERNIASWNTMLMGFAMHGHGKMALDLFECMRHSLGKVDEITFVSLLSAFSQAGMVKEGWWYFNKMRAVYGVEPNIMHYTCMVDLLGRAGLVDEAYRLVKDMPVQPDTVVWGALLGSCVAHHNVSLGEIVGKMLMDTEPKDGATYVALSNIYASQQRWMDVKTARDAMNDKGVKKSVGFSILNVNPEVI